MTILCLVRDNRDGGWAAFSDCLITSDYDDVGTSISSPIRHNHQSRETFGFSEVTLEEKLGLVKSDFLFGWAGNRSQAILKLECIKAEGAIFNMSSQIIDGENAQIFIQRHSDGTYYINIGPANNFKILRSGDFQFFFAGSGSKIISGQRFTADHKELGSNAQSVVGAALNAVSRFISEEMAGQHSQFYSLRTGGHYRIFCGSNEGIYQIRYCINHWRKNSINQPAVYKISMPYILDDREFLIDFDIGDDWTPKHSGGIGLAPLLQNPREKKIFQMKIEDILNARLGDYTLHVCWTEKAHRSFFVNVHEPQFDISESLYKYPHSFVTQEAVKTAFERMGL